MAHHLVIDAGNTRIKFAHFIGDALHDSFTWDPFSEVGLNQLLAAKHFDKVILSDVSGTALMKLQTFFKQEILVLGAHLKLPFANLYSTPNTLGADRIALVAGAMANYPNTNCLIIDAGTCVTYDLLRADAAFLGGNITPGLQMRLKAMHSFTGKLPLPEFSFPDEVLGTQTSECLVSGAYYGLIGEIEWLVQTYAQEFPALKTILTGGDAQLLAKRLKTNIFAEPQLLLYGLNKIASIND